MTFATGSCANSLNIRTPRVKSSRFNLLTKNSSRMKYLARVTSQSSLGSALPKILFEFCLGYFPKVIIFLFT